MPCTTILVGKKASYDGSTIIARNDDGGYTTKKIIIVEPKEQPKIYKSVKSHCKVELNEEPMKYTCIPNVDLKEGIWGTAGINQANVAMSATETIYASAITLGSDPLVEYKPAKGKQKEVVGGLGEEDFITLVLPYIKSAREGVLRLGALLEKYGTYEANGIAFADENECWYLETIGGHHYMAVRCKDDEVIIMPNQLGIDCFDFVDAYDKQENNLCSKDLLDLVKKNHLDTNMLGNNTRNIFGTHSDHDHIYNTPRAWDMGRKLCPTKYKWYGENADYTPTSDNIPFSFVPERKISIEEVKYLLSLHFQDTKYNPYQKADYPEKGIYRCIGTATTDDLAILQIRGYMPEKLKGVEWISFASNPFNAMCPIYTNATTLPKYLSQVKDEVDTNNLFWNARLIGVLTDVHFADNIMLVERYQKITERLAHQIINEYDEKYQENKDDKLLDEANKKAAEMLQNETKKVLYELLKQDSLKMKNRFNRGDN